ncbi:MAG: hypothetical protein J6K19_09055 [Prevotella sp.]|nr:hypothetical protein [Prevotella sp.]
MKRTLLLFAAAVMASGAFAADKLDSKALVKASKKVSAERMQVVAMEKGAARKSVQRSKATGLYYTVPEGTMFRHWDKNGSGYGNTRIVVSPFTKFTFTNKSENPTTNIWHLNNMYTGVSSDVTESMDADGNLSSILDAGYYFPAPTILNAAQRDSFCVGKTTNEFWNGSRGMANPDLYFTQVVTDSIAPVGFMDDHVQGGYGWGSLSTGFLYGSGLIDQTAAGLGIGICFGAEQSYPKPMSPLYVEDVFLRIYGITDTPIAEGKSLTMTITDTETSDTLAVLTATAADILGLEGPYNVQYSQTGVAYSGNLVFSKKEKDVLGNEQLVPFVIDRAFTVNIDGLDQDGVTIGFLGDERLEEYSDNIKDGLFLVAYPDVQEVYAHRYADLSMNITFDAVMDVAIIGNALSTSNGPIDNANVIRISEDGQTCYIDGNPDFPGLFVQTGMDWFDEDGNEYYYFDFAEDADWVESTVVDPGLYGDGTYGVSFTASPLGNNPGRYTFAYLKGRGIQSEAAVLIVQGNPDATAIDAVKNTMGKNSASAPIYNLNGQKVSKSAKGIMIQNGKKFISK